MNNGEDHLGEKTRKLLGVSQEERIYSIRQDFFMAYGIAQTCLSRLEEVLTSPASQRPGCVLVFGPTNNGKSAILREFRQRTNELREKAGGLSTDLVSIVCPAVPEMSRIYQKILERLRAPTIREASGAGLESRAYSVMADAGVKVLVLDEFQHLIAGSSQMHRTAIHSLKNMTTELGISIVAAGVETAYNAIEYDEQMANRFDPIYLPPWKYGPESKALMMTLEKRIPLEAPSNLASKSICSQVIRRTDGLIGEMVTFIRKAAIHAVVNSANCIDEGILSACGYRGPQERREQFRRNS